MPAPTPGVTPPNWGQQLLDHVATHSPHFDAERFKTGANTDLQAIQAACAAATAFSRGAVVQLSSRVWDVEGGLLMSGYSNGIQGVAAGHSTTDPTGTVLKATTQSGAVLDLTGWLQPGSFRGKVPFGGFAIEGSNVADATLANSGLRNSGVALGSVYFHDIVISRTGGPCIDMFRLYLSEMDRVVCVTPVSAKANDVPYARFEGCNGNRFIGLGFRSMVASDDTGPSGALLVLDDGTFPSTANVWLGAWFEFLHVPTNGTLIHTEANRQVWDGAYFVDCSEESGATGTSFVRFAAPSFADVGGNTWRGVVPGSHPTTPGYPDTGIRVSQSRNRIEGVKGFRGGNVTLEAGVTDTFVSLGGSESGATDPAVVDNSGSNTNVYLDYHLRTARVGAYVQDGAGTGNGPRFYDPAVTTNGALKLGTAGVKFQSVTNDGYLTGNAWLLRNLALTKTVRIDIDFRPGITLPDTGALVAAAEAQRGKLVFVHGAAGVADQLYVCRKTSADVYEWAQVTT